MSNSNENYDLNIEVEINKLLISDSDAELEENDQNANNWEVVRRPKRIPRQQQDHEHNHQMLTARFHQQWRERMIQQLVCKRCYGEHLTSECPRGGSVHGIGRSGAQVYRTGGGPRCFVCRRYETNHDSRTCPKRHPHSFRDTTICWGCGAGRHKISRCPERDRRCSRCSKMGHAENNCCWAPRNGHRRNC